MAPHRRDEMLETQIRMRFDLRKSCGLAQEERAKYKCKATCCAQAMSVNARQFLRKRLKQSTPHFHITSVGITNWIASRLSALTLTVHRHGFLHPSCHTMRCILCLATQRSRSTAGILAASSLASGEDFPVDLAVAAYTIHHLMKTGKSLIEKRIDEFCEIRHIAL